MKILYAGSPDISATVLEELIKLVGSNNNDDIKIVGVLTNPPSAKGRNKELTPTDVAQVAIKYDIPLFEPEKLDSEFRTKIEQIKPDLLVCFAFGKIFGPKFMSLFPLGGINLHPSLLPLYRGCAPVQAAILNMEEKTGITVQRLAQEMDSGDILLQTEIALNGTETAESLLDSVAKVGGGLFWKVILEIEAGNAKGIPQNHENATFCTMLKKEDGQINWNCPVKEIDAKVRAFYSWPSAFTFYNQLQLKILEASIYDGDVQKVEKPGTVLGVDKSKGILIQAASGVLCVKRLQLQTKKAMDFKDFLNGNRCLIGSVLG